MIKQVIACHPRRLGLRRVAEGKRRVKIRRFLSQMEQRPFRVCGDLAQASGSNTRSPRHHRVKHTRSQPTRVSRRRASCYRDHEALDGTPEGSSRALQHRASAEEVVESFISRLLEDFEHGKMTRTENQTTLAIGDVGEIIIRNRRSPASAAGTGDQVTGVINHISFGIEPWDKDDVEAELTRRGLAPRDDFQDGGFESYHVKDPDGWDLQISNQTEVG
jgi:hypothetical protein